MQEYNLHCMLHAVFQIQLYLYINLNVRLKLLFDFDFFSIEKIISTVTNITIHTMNTKECYPIHGMPYSHDRITYQRQLKLKYFNKYE